MTQRRIVFSLFLAVSLLTPASSSARTVQSAVHRNQPLRAATVSHGLKLSLAVPGRTYPKDALAQVTIELRNVSRHRVWAWTPGPAAPGFTFPQGQVLDDEGNVLYPPALKTWSPLPGPPPTLTALAPGYQLKARVYVVLGGPNLRLTLSVSPSGKRSDPQSHVAVSTPLLHVSLTSGFPPSIDVSISGGLYAVVEPARPVQGPMLYMESAICQPPTSQHLSWTPGVREIYPGCSNPKEWSIVAGWPNQRVARFDYLKGYPPPGPPGVVLQPHSQRVQQGVAYPFQLYTHCGVEFSVDFDAGFWDLADPAWAGREGNPPPSIGNPFQDGTMTLVDSEHAVFHFSGGDIHFTRHAGIKLVPGLCA